MNHALRKIAVFVGLGILGISIYWSQDGFNFDIAGDSGYTSMATFFAYFLAVAVTVLEFVFSSNFRDLNPSLILFGILSYVYSIYTNHGGIVHFQGSQVNQFGAWILAVLMDAVAEPLIAWGLYESRTGDFISNLIKSVLSSPDKIHESPKPNQPQQGEKGKPKQNQPFRPDAYRHPMPTYHGTNVKKGMGRAELERKFKQASERPHDSERPWFGE